MTNFPKAIIYADWSDSLVRKRISSGAHCESDVFKDFAYEAVSHVWGNPAKIAQIICEDKSLGITANLSEALIAFRFIENNRQIWADGICINQTDRKQHEAQVNLMENFFGSAQRVIGWLGPDPGQAEKMFNSIRGFNLRAPEYIQEAHVKIQKLQGYSPNLECSIDWAAVKYLFELPFFHRVWIIQWLGLAKEAVLWYGDYNISWPDISRFVFALDNKASFIVNHYKLSSWIVNHTYLIWKRFDDRPRYSFSEILHWARVHQSTDPHDLIFAFLGHPSAKIQGSLVLQPNYDKSYTHNYAYINIARNIITQSRILRIFSFVNRDDVPGSNNLRSWVPDWHAENKFMFVGYTGSAAPLGDSMLEIVPSSDQLVLKMCGFPIDSI
jgi:hypothetical protein